MIELHFSSFNHQKLIVEIEKRPCLWNLADKSYSDKLAKQKEWLEVAEKYFPEDWDNLTNKEKHEKVDYLVKKWKSIRDYYIREKKKSEEKSGKGAKSRRKYNPYFVLLSFLDNAKPAPSNSSNVTSPEHNEDNYGTESNEVIDEEDEIDMNTAPQFSELPIELISEPSSEKAHSSETLPWRPKKKFKMTPFQECLLQKIESKNEDDPNRHFLLSLVPEMTKMTDRQNFQFRIGVMRILNEVKYRLPDGLPNCSSFLSPTSDSNSSSKSIVNDEKYPPHYSDSENE